MNNERRILLSFVTLLVICGALAFAVSTFKEHPGIESRLTNLSDATIVEIQDRSSRRVMSGEFRTYTSAVHETVRFAPLVAERGDAVGSVEIELTRYPNGTLVQEVEVDMEGLSAYSAFDVVVDGRRIGLLTTDGRGAAEFERFGRVAEASIRSGD